MTHWKLIIGTILLACTASTVPPVAMYLLSRNHAVVSEERHLSLEAENSILHADSLIQDATSGLHELERISPHDCSQNHIQAMRAVVMAHRSIEEVGFYRNGQRVCSSWGMTDEVLLRQPPDYFVRSGVGIQLQVLPKISLGRNAIALQSGSYNVLLDPQLLVDTVIENDMDIALANEQRQIIATVNHPSTAMVRYAMEHLGSGEKDGLLYSAVRSQDWIAITIEKRSYIAADFRRQRVFMLPLGFFLAGLIFLAVLWSLRLRLSPQAELDLAIRNREFIVYYQPIVNLRNGLCIGAEALIRWQRPGSGIFGPNAFIPLAEEHGLISRITALVMDRVTSEMASLLRRNKDFHISVNLSATDMETGHAIAHLDEVLRKHHIPKDRLWLEITERTFIHPDKARTVLAAARAEGHRILIDDFGTGYSNLSLLHSLPLDLLKIDKSFIDSIGTESPLGLVVPHVIEMAKNLNLQIVAEGVETKEQADYCRTHGIRYAQGWLFAEAMPPNAFKEYLAANTAQ